jgi:hypothetical protein
MRNQYTICGKSQKKRQLRRTRSRWENRIIIQMNLSEMGREAVKEITNRFKLILNTKLTC